MARKESSMDTQQIDEKAVFNAARRIADAAARDDYLAQACGDDQPAIQRIRELLRIHEQEQSFLESPAADLRRNDRSAGRSPSGPARSSAPTSCCSRSAKAAWASSSWPSRPSRSSARSRSRSSSRAWTRRQVIARFEAERQALALMDHPNIARSSTPARPTRGRPYFVMELVHGVPITEYCDEQPPHAAAAAGAVRRRSARRSSTPIRKGSSTATSSRPTSWSPCTTASRCPR